MKALSIKQPWASLIMSGRKEIEVRTWKTDYRGLLTIHAGKKIDREAMDFFMGYNPNRPRCRIVRGLEFPTGCILGKIKLGTVVLMKRSEWKGWKEYHCIPWPFPGHPNFPEFLYAWWLSNPNKLKDPIPHKGQQGLFNVDDSLLPW